MSAQIKREKEEEEEEEEKYAFSATDFDWDIYAQGRPQYSDSLWNQILTYHKSHGGAFTTAHDIGCGHGIVAKTFLLNTFEKVYISDPVPHNLTAAKHFLSTETKSAKIITSLSAAEDSTWLPPSSIDLLTAFECLHWTDPQKSFRAFSTQLVPGGTLSAIIYNTPFILSNPRAQRAWTTACKKFYTNLHKTYKTGMEQMRGYLDACLPLPTSDFEAGARRIRVNEELYKKHTGRERGVLDEVLELRGVGPPESFVGATDQCERVDDEETWSHDADAEWFKNCIISTQAFKGEEIKVVEEDLQEIAVALEEAGGRVRVCWVADIVLATKRLS